MKLKNLIAVVAIAVAGIAHADTSRVEDLTDSNGNLVKNNFEQCVTVLKNKGLTGCGVVAAAPKQVETVTETQVITLGADAYFDFDKSTLKPEGKAKLNELVNQINSRVSNINRITVVGNTDSVGSEKYNQGLSERRAAAVGNYLIANGVPAHLIEAYGNSFRNPVADNRTAEGRAQNRRVDVTIEGLVERAVQK